MNYEQMSFEQLKREKERCNLYLERAEDRHDLDTFNHYWCIRERINTEIKRRFT
jgi:hypothetical protein